MKSLREYIDIIKEADGVTNPWPAGTPHAAAWDTMSPEDKKWLGGADPTDKYILARAPNGGKPVAKPAPVAAPAPAAVATPVAEPAPAAPAQQQAANPTPAPKPVAPSDSKVLTLQNKLIGLGAKIKADGIMGPATQAAMKEYGLDINGNPVKDAKTGQPVTNDKTANAIIQRGGVAPAEITKDMTVAQQVRSDLEAQRANTMTRDNSVPVSTRSDGQQVYTTQSGKQVALNSLTDKRNQRQAEYQAQNQAFLAKQAEERAAKAAAASGQGPKPVTATTPAAPVQQQAAPVQQAANTTSPAPATANPNPGPRPTKKTDAFAWNEKYGATHDPRTGAPLQEGIGYDELDRLVSLVHYR